MTLLLIVVIISWLFWGCATTKNKKFNDMNDLEDLRDLKDKEK